MRYLITLLIAFSLLSCTKQESIITIDVKEPAGIDRPLEYIELQWMSTNKPKSDDKFSLSSVDGLVEGQVLNLSETVDGQFSVSAIFPISIKANESKKYTVVPRASKLIDTLKVSGSGVSLIIENETFRADLTSNTYNPEKPYAPGIVQSLILKNYNDQLIRRTKNNMHWSPNFQGNGLEYRGLSNMTKPDSVSGNSGPYKTVVYSEGKVDGYPEITLKATYEFYSGVPYYVFSSEIYINQGVKLGLLRNDEMTMDSLFTHVIFKDKAHGIKEGLLYEGDFFDELTEDPIEHDALWLGFYNKNRNYGYGSIRLEYSNTNQDGRQSPMYKPHTKISRGSNGGRYWNRRLIHEQETFVPRGSRYNEKNAYFVFDSRGDVSDSINDLYKKLHLPLEVKYK